MSFTPESSALSALFPEGVAPISGFRREHDSLGEKAIPLAADWGIHGVRALDNFLISGQSVMGCALYKSVKHLTQACGTFQVHGVEGIEAQHDLPGRQVAESVTLVTALNPISGCEKAALIAKTALLHGGSIETTAEMLGSMSREGMEALLVPDKLTQPMRAMA